MKLLKALLLFVSTACLLPLGAQDVPQHRITIQVETPVEGESLAGQPVELTCRNFSFNGTLNAEGIYSVLAYEGHCQLAIERAGYLPYGTEFELVKDTTVQVKLAEATQTPYALKSEIHHNAVTGQNDVSLTWNIADPVFFDGFESYEDFSINETGNEWNGWTGIDGDRLNAGHIDGTYPNAGKLQYAMVINPMEAGEPAWWYKFEQMRPYEGMKYMGFFRTQSGEANDDWLISPPVTVERNNILQFMAKAGHENPERFVVGITTVTDNPQPADFTNLTPGNYETADSWETWRAVEYDLADYEGQTVRIAIHYIGDANRYGSMMLMVDNFYIGQRQYEELPTRRVSARSAANPNETFRLYLDNELVDETEAYTYRFENLTEGSHTLAVEAVYKSGVVSDKASLDVTLSNDTCRKLTVNVTTNNGTAADGKSLEVLNTGTAEAISVAVSNGKAELLSLPRGTYNLSINDELYEPYGQDTTLADEDITLSVELQEKRFTPYNITADVAQAEDGTFEAVVKWNQDLGFYDSFEDYEDFAQESFGEWTSIDVDGLPVYPISLGGTEVTFPGSSNTGSTKPMAPIVFNPSATRPSMSVDGLIAPTHGAKEILFNNPQSDMVNYQQTDKWLITPLQSIRDGYVMRFNAAGYDFMETLEICVSATGTDPGSFTKIGEITTGMGEWNQYEVDLSGYANQEVYIGIHCVSFGGWLCMLDEVFIGSADGSGEAADVGAVQHYEVSLDGGDAQQTTEAAMTFTGLAEGEHTVNIVAVYASGRSETATYTFEVKKDGHNGLDTLSADGTVVLGGEGEIRVWTRETTIAIYSTDGLLLEMRPAAAGANVFAAAPGVYLVQAGGRACKTVVR